MFSTNSETRLKELVREAGYCLVIEYQDAYIRAAVYKDGIFVKSLYNSQLGINCVVQRVYEEVLKENNDSLRDACVALYKNGYSSIQVDKIIRQRILNRCKEAIDNCFTLHCDFIDIDVLPMNRFLGERMVGCTNHIFYFGSLSEVTDDYREQLKVGMEKLYIEVTRANDCHYLDKVILTGYNSSWWRKLIQDIFCEQDSTKIHLLQCR